MSQYHILIDSSLTYSARSELFSLCSHFYVDLLCRRRVRVALTDFDLASDLENASDEELREPRVRPYR